MTQTHITIVAFCGPSGSGKSVLVSRLLELYPDNLAKWKQATTRPRRDASDDYVFMTKAMYDVVRSTLTCRTEFNGNSYGTFPEPTANSSAVLTIADATGLSDLVADVANHNNHVNNGHQGKLGSRPVKLVTVLMTYKLTDEEIEKRGGTRGGTRDAAFLQNELDRLNEIDDWFTFDVVLESSGDRWTQPEEFFSDVIWPAICTPVNGLETAESLYAQIEHQLVEIGEGCGAGRNSNDLDMLRSVLQSLVGVSDYVNEWIKSEPEDGTDAIDDILSAPAGQVETGLDNAEQIYRQNLEQATAIDPACEHPSDYLNDRTPEAPAADVIAVEAEVTTATAPAPEVPSVEAVIGQVDDTAPAEIAVAEIAPVEIAPVVEEAVPYAPLTAYGEIFAATDFTDWLLEHTIGVEAFASDDMFRTIFSQYVSSHGGNPNGIQVSQQSTRDGKGGRVVEYTAILPDGSRYAAEFNERIKQVVAYGPR